MPRRIAISSLCWSSVFRASVFRSFAGRALLHGVLVAAIAVPAPRHARGDDGAAQVDGDPSTRAARHHFETAERLFALGRFTEALREYEAAFEAKPLPAFLFNIGQCHRNLGDHAEAIFSFRKYLRLAPDAPNRDAVNNLIAELEEARRRQEAKAIRSPGDQPRSKAPAPRDRPFYGRWWFWTGVAAIAGAGVGTYVLTRGDDVPSTTLGNVVFAVPLP